MSEGLKEMCIINIFEEKCKNYDSAILVEECGGYAEFIYLLVFFFTDTRTNEILCEL